MSEARLRIKNAITKGINIGYSLGTIVSEGMIQGAIGRSGKQARLRGLTKASQKRFKKVVNNLSKPENPGLSQQKLNQLRRISGKANAKVRVDLEGVRGSGVKPHAHIEGMGSKVESRHIWLKKGVR